MGKAPSVEQLRAEVQHAIRKTSARSLARELDVSPTGLLKFTDNPASTVYEKTYRKLVAWHERRVATGFAAPEADVVAPAVGILVHDIRRDLGAEEERRVRKEIAGVLGEVFAGRQGVDEAVDAALGE